MAVIRANGLRHFYRREGNRRLPTLVLAHPIGVVPGHDGVEGVGAAGRRLESRTVSIAVDVVAAAVVRVPDLDRRLGQRFAAGAEHPARHRQRHPGVSRDAHRAQVRSVLLVERPQRVLGRARPPGRLVPGRGDRGRGEAGGHADDADGDALFQEIATAQADAPHWHTPFLVGGCRIVA